MCLGMLVMYFPAVTLQPKQALNTCLLTFSGLQAAFMHALTTDLSNCLTFRTYRTWSLASFGHAGVALSQPLCLALLSVFEACGQSGQAQDVLTAASDAAIPLSVELYNAVLRCCILAQHGERAIEVWEEMQVLRQSLTALRSHLSCMHPLHNKLCNAACRIGTSTVASMSCISAQYCHEECSA